jgi:uncharacterized repeat protein (TIGR01451 family)
MTRQPFVRTTLTIGLTVFALVAGSGSASADDCVALGGTISSGECRISSLVSRSGSFSLDETLHILGNGRLNVPQSGGGNSLTLTITGDLLIDVPSLNNRGRIAGDVSGNSAIGATIVINVTGDIHLEGNGTTGGRISSTQSSGACANGRAGNLLLTAAGNFVAESGSSLSVNGSCPAGRIDVNATNAEIAGVVLSESTRGGAGQLRPGGGPITMVASCSLLVDQTGIVRSRGTDPGADLVHLQGGCDVALHGLVASTGQGHVPPTNPPNHCHGPARFDKPADATGCVEIWAGDTLTIDSVGSRRGEVQADVSQPGGGIGQSWVDLFARGDITLLGGASGPFAVHANGGIAGASGGDIRIISAQGALTASLRAVQANAAVVSGKGGEILLATAVTPSDIDLGNALVQARGGSSGPGRAGGKIGVKSHNGTVLGTASSQLSATGGALGEITLTACTGLAYDGANNPPTGETSGICGGLPAVSSYVVFPVCACAPVPQFPNVRVEKTGNGPLFAGEVARFTITVTNDGPGAAEGVTLSDPLPSGLTWTEDPDNPSCGIDGSGTLDCSIGTMAQGATFIVTVRATTVAANCPTLTNVSTVAATNEDPLKGDDNTATDTIVVGCPDLQISKQGNGTINAGEKAIFTITVTNIGIGTATGVSVTDTLPAVSPGRKTRIRSAPSRERASPARWAHWRRTPALR